MSAPPILTVSRIEEALRAREPRRIKGLLAWKRSAVALVLKPGSEGAEALLIQRAEREGDPWSGHMALPGGRREDGDPSLAHTARRETREELGLDLQTHGRMLGRLDDQQAKAHGRALPMAITPVVFALEGQPPPLEPDPREVQSALWVPLAALRSGEHDEVYTWRAMSLVPIDLPSWRYQEKLIWGLTHRMLSGLLRRV
ncbi:MAG: NUDIX hydrolase [Planctomycetota bacterium]